MLAVVAAALLALLHWQRRFVATAMPTVAVPLPGMIAEATLYAGTAACALALAILSAQGFAPGGHLPVLAAALFVGGALLVAVRPAPRRRLDRHRESPRPPLRDGAHCPQTHTSAS